MKEDCINAYAFLRISLYVCVWPFVFVSLSQGENAANEALHWRSATDTWKWITPLAYCYASSSLLWNREIIRAGKCPAERKRCRL